MISAEELHRITSSYRVNGPEIIPIEGEDFMEFDGRNYILHRKDGDFTVTGIVWGYGHLFIMTKERERTSIRYEHETIALKTVDDEDIEPDCEEVEDEEPKFTISLDRWLA